MKLLWNFLSDLLVENGAYKIVAFFISLVLWGTVLVRRDVVYVKSVDLEYVINEKHVLSNDVVHEMEVRLAGSRVALKSYSQRPLGPITMDLTNVKPGLRTIEVPEDSLRLPPGVRVISMNPANVMVDVREGQERKLSIEQPLMPEAIKDKVEILAVVPNDLTVVGTPEVLGEMTQLPIEPIRWTPKLEARWAQLRPGENMDFTTRLSTVRGLKVSGFGGVGRESLKIQIVIRKLK